MRDDLHKSVSLRRSWSAVLRKLSRDKYTPEMLAPFIINAVHQEISGPNGSDWRALEALIAQPDIDLFEDGVTSMRRRLRRMQEGELTVGARLACEIALGVLSDKGLSASFFRDVRQAVCSAYASDQLELIVAQVFSARGAEEAEEVGKQFSKSLECCDFCNTSSPRAHKKTVDQLLSTELELSL
ncbi:hypothetical protein [Pseudoduganella rhizocola]|uniref:hypothetical protein n=1 Tax=Pseudoduganella rhizocola TaxID=3382643 RepID=UPI0038B4336D